MEMAFSDKIFNNKDTLFILFFIFISFELYQTK